MIGLKKDTVKLVAYDTDWSKLFKQEKTILNKTLQENYVKIEHIGSTAIPNISAKPIIDIDLGIKSVENLSKVEKIANLLKNLDYEWRKESSKPNHHIFAKGPEEKRTVYLHLIEYNGKVWKNDLLFRNYLRKHLKEAKEYEDLKRKLAAKYPDQRDKYTESKAEFIRKILSKAKSL